LAIELADAVRPLGDDAALAVRAIAIVLALGVAAPECADERVLAVGVDQASAAERDDGRVVRAARERERRAGERERRGQREKSEEPRLRHGPPSIANPGASRKASERAAETERAPARAERERRFDPDGEIIVLLVVAARVVARRAEDDPRRDT